MGNNTGLDSDISLTADELVKQATIKRNSIRWKWNKDYEMEMIMDMYLRAANIYKEKEEWKEAVDALIQAATCSDDLSEMKYVDYVVAANMLQNINKAGAVELLRKAITLYINKGDLHSAGKYSMQIAQMYEDLDDISGAISAYKVAISHYEQANIINKRRPSTSIRTCQHKIIKLLVQSDLLEEAGDIYMTLACSSHEDKLYRTRSSQYCMMAGLCFMCLGDHVLMLRSLDRYYLIDPEFKESKHDRLLRDLSDCLLYIEPEDKNRIYTVLYDITEKCQVTDKDNCIYLSVKGAKLLN